MKKIIFLISIVSLLTSCILDEPKAIDTPTYRVNCRFVYIETLDHVTHEIDFDCIETSNLQCVNDLDNFVVAQIVESCQ